MSKRKRDARVDALARYASAAYPHRYPRMLVAGNWAFLAFEADDSLDGTRPFATWLHLAHRDWHESIERARREAVPA